MLIQERDTGLRHFVGKEEPFGIDTICGKSLVSDEFIKVEGDYTKCTCEKCFDEIDRDLHRRPAKKEKVFPV